MQEKAGILQHRTLADTLVAQSQDCDPQRAIEHWCDWMVTTDHVDISEASNSHHSWFYVASHVPQVRAGFPPDRQPFLPLPPPNHDHPPRAPRAVMGALVLISTSRRQLNTVIDAQCAASKVRPVRNLAPFQEIDLPDLRPLLGSGVHRLYLRAGLRSLPYTPHISRVRKPPDTSAKVPLTKRRDQHGSQGDVVLKR